MNIIKNEATSYRPDIDGLRAIAVLAVVAFHAGIPGIGGGFVGVDIFFVISGYLITGLLLQELEATGGIHLTAFFARRIRRLLPALLLVVTATLLLGVVLMFPQELPRLGKSATATMFLASNIHFLNYSGGYFDPSTDLMPMLHMWSLSVEEQYYLTWPLLLLFPGWYVRRVRSVDISQLAFLTLVLIFGFSAGLNSWYAPIDQSATFYLMPMRAWEFALGGLARLSHRRVELSPRAGGLMALSGFAAIIMSVAFVDDSFRFPVVTLLMPTLGAAMLMFGLHYAGNDNLTARLLSADPMVRVGLLSYSWYLWHWPLLSLTRAYFLGEREPVRDGLVVLLALFAAALSYRFVECPIRYRKPWLFAKPRGSLIVGAALSFLVVILAQGTIHLGKESNRRMNEQLWKSEPVDGNPFGEGRCKEPKDGKALAPQHECVLGNGDSKPSLFVWGDSHAEHFGRMFLDYASQNNKQVLVRTFGACPPIVGAIPYKRQRGQFPCGHFNDLVIAEAQAMASSGFLGVILASRWNAYVALPVTEPGGIASYALASHWHELEAGSDFNLKVGVAPLDTAGSSKTLVESLRRTLTVLHEAGIRVLIVAPTPELYFNGPHCLYRRSAVECVASRQRVNERRATVMSALSEAVTGFDNVRIWDPIAQFCDERSCYAIREGVVMYVDDNHITQSMSRQLLPVAQPYLDWLAAPR